MSFLSPSTFPLVSLWLTLTRRNLTGSVENAAYKCHPPCSLDRSEESMKNKSTNRHMTDLIWFKIECGTTVNEELIFQG